jgi:predicted esterase
MMPIKQLLFCTLAVFVASTSLPGGEPAKGPAATTGPLHLIFTERSPLSSVDVLLQRMDLTTQPGGAESLAYNPAGVSFEVFVPPSYRPELPHGLFVWMGVSEFSPTWLNVLARHNLILVSANTVKGHVARYPAPLDAVHNLRKLYRIDENRVYASGFSAGGAMATMMVRGFPDVFRGGLFLMGGYFYHCRKSPDGRGEPTVEGPFPAWKGPLDQIKREEKLVLMKGGSDPEWTPQEGRSDYQALWLDGFIHVTYLEVPKQGHMHPDAAWFERGVAALDQSTPLTPPIISPTEDPNPLPGQIAQARRILATAQFYLEAKVTYWEKQLSKRGQDITDKIRKSNQNKARKYLQQVLDEYPTTPAAAHARTLLSGMDRTTTGQNQ